MICLLGRYTFYDFADPENDPASIESGDIMEIKFISQDTVVAMTKNPLRQDITTLTSITLEK